MTCCPPFKRILKNKAQAHGLLHARTLGPFPREPGDMCLPSPIY
jgi:hypothetical protein